MNALAVDEMPALPPPTVPPALPELARPVRFECFIDLAALPTAMLCARLFVASTLERWGARFLEADAELLAVELVRYSVATCGVLHPETRIYQLEPVALIRLRLLGFDRSIGIEVWDTATEPARQREQDRAGELDGLGLVDRRAQDWGWYFAPGGRVVWAELGVYERTGAGLPRRTRSKRPHRQHTTGWPEQQHDLDLLERVRNGLVGL